VITVSQYRNIFIDRIECTDQRAAAPPHTIVGDKIELNLGTLDSQGSPYRIRINAVNVHCIITLPFQSPQFSTKYYCMRKPKIEGYDENFELSLDSYENYTLKYGFISPKG
jgi:hypothetical protein